MYDIIFCASSHKSVLAIARMVTSMEYLDGKCLIVVVSPDLQEAMQIADSISTIGNSVDKIVFVSKIDNMYVGRAWGAVWSIFTGFDTRYFCFCDDDLEFTDESRWILGRLNMTDFSIMTFDNVAQAYNKRGDGELNRFGQLVGINWINGDSMFVHSEDVLKYGVTDCLPDGQAMPYFVESEYQKRLMIATGRPIVVDLDRVFYIHHFRDDPVKVTLRSTDGMKKIESGCDFFRQKYSIASGIDFNHPDTHSRLLAIMRDSGEEVYNRHLIFGGLSPSVDGWKAIYDYFADKFEYVW